MKQWRRTIACMIAGLFVAMSAQCMRHDIFAQVDVLSCPLFDNIDFSVVFSGRDTALIEGAGFQITTDPITQEDRRTDTVDTRGSFQKLILDSWPCSTVWVRGFCRVGSDTVYSSYRSVQTRGLIIRREYITASNSSYATNVTFGKDYNVSILATPVNNVGPMRIIRFDSACRILPNRKLPPAVRKQTSARLFPLAKGFVLYAVNKMNPERAVVSYFNDHTRCEWAKAIKVDAFFSPVAVLNENQKVIQLIKCGIPNPWDIPARQPWVATHNFDIKGTRRPSFSLREPSVSKWHDYNTATFSSDGEIMATPYPLPINSKHLKVKVVRYAGEKQLWSVSPTALEYGFPTYANRLRDGNALVLTDIPSRPGLSGDSMQLSVFNGSDGQLRWYSRWGHPVGSTYEFLTVRKCVEAKDGAIYALGDTRKDGYDLSVLLKFSSTGALLWQRYLSAYKEQGINHINHIFLGSPGIIYLVGYYCIDSNGPERIALFKIRE